MAEVTKDEELTGQERMALTTKFKSLKDRVSQETIAELEKDLGVYV
jgi:hypothetical protein